MAKVGVLGARGRMGHEAVRTVTEAPDLEVGAEVDQGDALDALTGCDVVVDFTHPGVVMSNRHWCVLDDVDVLSARRGSARTGSTRYAAGSPSTRTCASWSCRTSPSAPS